MNKKAVGAGTLAVAVLAIALLVFVVITIFPQISKLLSASSGIRVCKETGLAEKNYQEDIEFLLGEFDVSASSDEDEEEIVEFYKEFVDCFPDNDFDSYVENIREQDTFSFIFVMKEQKHYDRITLKIAQRYLVRFPASARVSDVQSYVNEAKATI